VAGGPAERPAIDATETTMKSVYFAWVRERIGKTGEDIAPPANVVTIGDLIAWLSGRGEGYATAFANPGIICAAIDRTRVRHDATIAGAGEIAFFPPMTGG
jgi:molybdopterin synthase sulfur carrier subunit